MFHAKINHKKAAVAISENVDFRTWNIKKNEVVDISSKRHNNPKTNALNNRTSK